MNPNINNLGGNNEAPKSACDKYKGNSDTFQLCSTQCYNNPTKAATDPECVRSFACESIFADHTSATKCNYTRCLGERSENYCSCKYGDK